MEFIYLWTKDYYPFDFGSFNFNGNFNVSIDINEESKIINISIIENNKFPANLFGTDIVNLSCIIGKNGSGKTRLSQLLINILIPDSWYSLPEYILIHFDPIKKEFDLKHNLYEFDENIFHQPKQGKEIYDIQINLPHGYSEANSYHIKKSQIVYYTPFLDLKNFPIRVDRKSYIDVSTDFMIILDKESVSRENDILAIHRFKNVERQLSFVNKFVNNININNYFPLPNEIEVYSLEPKYDEHWNHNLSYSAQPVRVYFLGDQKNNIRGIILDKIYDIGGKIYVLNNENKYDSEEYLELLLQKVRMFFLYDFVAHYFYCLNYTNHWLDIEIGINIDEFKGLDEWQSFALFLSKETWLLDNGESSLNLLQGLNAFLSKDIIRIERTHDDRKVISKNSEIILHLLDAQLKYLQSVPTWQGLYSLPDLFQIDWRDLSSGEKAFLDIFSRLNFAHTLVKDRDIDKYSRKFLESTEWVYLFLDEGEIGFHPDWQKRYVYLLHSVLPNIFQDMKIQIVLTSHSPFVASDLPTENIIFLNKRNGVVEINQETILNTFGANIHTLLADGFFISNGLIGEFAKNKIQEVIDWLNDSGSDVSPKKVEDMSILISLIGEPIIKNKLLTDLDRKLGRNDEINKIDRELRRLQTLKEQLIQTEKDAEA